MAGLPFIDSNVLLYAYSSDPRADQASQILAQPHVFSVQVLNEFISVAKRKHRKSWGEIDMALAAAVKLASGIHPITLETHFVGRELAQRYQLQIYDSLIIGSALEHGCPVVFSEDMQDGMVIENRLTIRNPFT